MAQKAINYEYLWNEIRVKGGAYGCGIKPDIDGEVGFYTFRDPNLDDSLARMDACASWIESYEPTEEDLEGYIVSTLAAHDSPKKPYQVARRQDGLYLARRDPLWNSQRPRRRCATLPRPCTASPSKVGSVFSAAATSLQRRLRTSQSWT